MVDSLRRVQLAAVATLLTMATAATAKPTVTVVVKIDPEDTHFRKRLASELEANHQLETPEQYIASQFIETFSTLRMFQFTAAAAPKLPLTIVLHLSSNDLGRRWPANDLRLTMQLSSDVKPPIKFVLFRRAVCGERDCVPHSFVDPSIYRKLFGDVIRQWPDGMLHSIVLTTTARYEDGGRIRTTEAISEFGQIHDGIPDALFEILFETTQRQFAFCLENQVGNWRALGKDQGPAPVAAPSCFVAPTSGVRGGSNGRVTLLRAFPREVP